MTDEQFEVTKRQLEVALVPYITWAKAWWVAHKPELYTRTGSKKVIELAGLYIKTTKSLHRSAVPGFPTVPIVEVSALQLPPIEGGKVAFLKKLLATELCLDGILFIPKVSLVSAYSAGHYLCLVPKKDYEDRQKDYMNFKWALDLTYADLVELRQGIVPVTLQVRLNEWFTHHGVEKPTHQEERKYLVERSIEVVEL